MVTKTMTITTETCAKSVMSCVCCKFKFKLSLKEDELGSISVSSQATPTFTLQHYGLPNSLM